MPEPQYETRTPEQHFEQLVTELNIPRQLALAIKEQESGRRPFQTPGGDVLTSSKNARGWFQVLPETAAGYKLDANDPFQNIEAGLRYIKEALDKNHNDPDIAARYYHGGPDRKQWGPVTEQYGTAVGKRLRALLAADGGAATPATTATPRVGGPPPRPGPDTTGALGALNKASGIGPTTFLERHPALGTLADSLDPHEQEGRRNIAGAAGGAIAGGIGGYLTGGLGAAAIATGGAAVAGGLEDYFVEQTGLGDQLAKWLPGGTTNNPVEGAPSTPSDRLARAAKVGGEQGVYDMAGQVLASPLRYFGRAALESRIGRNALHAITERKNDAVARLYAALDSVRAARDGARAAEAQAGRTLATDAATQVEAAREAARLTLEGVRDTAATDVAAAGLAKRQDVRAAAATGRLAQQTAADDTAAALEARRVAHEAAMRATAESGLQVDPQTGLAPLGTPSLPSAGRAVAEVFQGPGQAALDEAGQAIPAATATGPERSLVAVKEEARRIAEEELAPPGLQYPGQPPTPPPAPGAPPVPGQPPVPPLPATGDRLTAFLALINNAQLQQLVNHPAMRVISRILNAPDTVDFATLHQLESQLRQSVQGSGDRVVNDYVTNITRHLVGRLRATLAGDLEEGAVAHAPFEAATAHYRDIVSLFTEGHAPLIRDVARHAPEQIVQALSPDRPSHAQMLVRVLTEQAAEGGGPAGRQAGQEALQRVQDAWLHRNVLEGPVDGLADRLTALRRRPEFVAALFNTPRAQQALSNAEAIAAAFAQTRTAGTQAVRTARETARTAVGAATDRGEAAVAAARRKAAAAIRAERTTGRAAVAAEKSAGAARKESHKRSVEAAGQRARQQVRGAVADVRSRKASLGTSAEEAEERAWETSGLNPRVSNSASPRARQLEAAVRFALSSAGLAHAGPAGLMLGALFRSGQGISEAELLRYVVHSGPLTRLVINGLLHPVSKQAANTTAGAVVRGVAHDPEKTPGPGAAKITKGAADLYLRLGPERPGGPPPREP